MNGIDTYLKHGYKCDNVICKNVKSLTRHNCIVAVYNFSSNTFRKKKKNDLWNIWIILRKLQGIIY